MSFVCSLKTANLSPTVFANRWYGNVKNDADVTFCVTVYVQQYLHKRKRKRVFVYGLFKKKHSTSNAKPSIIM